MYRHIEPLMDDRARLAAALRLVKAAGFSFDDQRVVMNAGIGYAGGNSWDGMSEVWVTGNWNDISHYDRETGTRVVTSTMPGRLFEALERLGVNGEWYDEHDMCGNCYKLVRTQPNSYGWTPDYVDGADGITCHDCVLEDVETYLDEYVNVPYRAITWLTAEQLVANGWHDAMPDEHDAEHGMHPGQNDTPESVLARWHATLSADDETPDYVFLVTDKGQFDMRFRLFARNAQDESEE